MCMCVYACVVVMIVVTILAGRFTEQGSERVSVHVLAPCYSFPGMSFLTPLPPHVTVDLYSPTCSPE
jgi:hypothetical protein